MNHLHRFALTLPLALAGFGCTTSAGDPVDSSSQASTQAQDIAFECTCDDEACRVPGLMDFRAYYVTGEDSLHVRTFFGTSMLSTANTSNFVGVRADASDDQVVFERFEHVSASTLEPAEPIRPEDELLVGASIRIDRALLETGPEYSGEEVPPSPHRSFGFVDVERDGELYSYTCIGLWRENI